MATANLVFEHIHIISEDPHSAADWYVDMLGGEIAETYELRGAPQIAVVFEGITILIRGRRPGENPEGTNSIQSFGDFASHNEWGADHFAFLVHGDLAEFCNNLKAKGATFSIEPNDSIGSTWGGSIAYLNAPDGVSVELLQA